MLYDIPFYQLFILSIDGLLKIFFHPIFYFVVFMVYWQCKNLAGQQKTLFGHENIPLWLSVLELTVLGLLGGLFASMVVLTTGLSINNLGIEYIWPLALLLLLVNMRFLCFAYAGGIVALANALFGWPEVAASHVLALVAILHITESILVFTGSRYSALPVYVNFQGKTVGGFLLSSFWPLPLLLTVVVVMPEGELAGALAMPEWWPLFPVQQAPTGMTNVLLPITIAAVLGYSSVALTGPPEAKRRFSAFVLFVYSLLLLFLAYLSIGNSIYAVIAALFSIFGHELAVHLDQRMEAGNKPIYQGCPDKLVVLSTLFDSPASYAGLRTNDIIVDVDGHKIYDQGDLQTISDFLPEKFTMQIMRAGKQLSLNFDLSAHQGRDLGIIRMPVQGKDKSLSFAMNHSILIRWYKKYKRYKSLQRKTRG